jgi:hypothetical protein
MRLRSLLAPSDCAMSPGRTRSMYHQRKRAPADPKCQKMCPSQGLWHTTSHARRPNKRTWSVTPSAQLNNNTNIVNNSTAQHSTAQHNTERYSIHVISFHHRIKSNTSRTEVERIRHLKGKMDSTSRTRRRFLYTDALFLLMSTMRSRKPTTTE